MIAASAIECRLIDLLARCASLDPSALSPSLSLGRELELDSMSAIAFQCDIEAEFDLDFPIERLIELDNIANVATVLVKAIQISETPS